MDLTTLNLSVYLNPKLIILVVVIYILGVMLKNLNVIKNSFIPFVLLVVSIILCGWMLGFTAEAVIQAFIVTAMAVYSNQLFKQGVEAIKTDTTNTAPKEINPTNVTEFRK